MAINNVTLMGRLTAIPELKTTNSGTYVTSFTLAVDRPYQSDTTDFISCVAWKKTAEFISKYFGKGNMIGIVGSIQTRNYEDKTGAKRTAVEVVVDKVSFCGAKVETHDMEEVEPDINEGLPF